VLRKLGNLLLKSGEVRWAWAIHERVCEHWLDREGERSAQTVGAVLQFVYTASAAKEHAIAQATFRRYLSWLLSKSEISDPTLRALVPLVWEARSSLEF
jgi:hypothetical protein